MSIKIKTITCHNVYNHGASLQEHALIAYLNSIGHNAKAINYQPGQSNNLFKLSVVSNPKFDLPIIRWLYILAKLPIRLFNLKKKRAFDLFSVKYIPSGGMKYTSNDELKANLPNADVFICGSDQIWNTLFENGKDPAFYLDFVPKDKLKISYAASFATEKLDDKYKEFVYQNLIKFDAISVRESSGVEILKNINVLNVTRVLDPVFLLPYHYWVTEFVQPMADDFVFIYDFDSNPVIKAIAQDLKSKHGCKIFTINENINYADKNFYLEGPETYLTLMYNAKLVLTNSFHAIAFSLIFKKQFYLFKREEQINSRMLDLLNLFGLNSRLIQSKEHYENTLIDYDSISDQLEKEIILSKQFIENSLLISKV